jgi:hypothetical protein
MKKKRFIRPTRKEIDDIFEKFGVERRGIMAEERNEIEIVKLQPHAHNEMIYGVEEDVSDLVAQIEAVGRILDPLKIKEDGTIISGHRRWKAAKALNYTAVPYEYVSFDSDEEELAALVLYNYGRTKTNEQKAREGMALFETLSVEAVQRRLANLNQNNPEMDTSSTSDKYEGNADTDTKLERGLTRDKVAQAVGISSGKTFDRMREVLKKVDQLKKEGNTADSEIYIAVLNRAPSAAKELLDIPLDKLTDEIKNNIKTGKVTPRAFWQEALLGKKEKSKNYHDKIIEGVKTIHGSMKAIEKPLTRIEDYNQQAKIHESLESTITKLRNLKRCIAIHDDYDEFIGASNIYQSTVSELVKSIPTSKYDYYLEDFRDYVEEQIKGLQELLSVIESELEKKKEPVEPASKTDTKKSSKKNAIETEDSK